MPQRFHEGRARNRKRGRRSRDGKLFRRFASKPHSSYHSDRGKNIVKKADEVGGASAPVPLRSGDDQVESPGSLRDAMAESDPAYPILSGILDLRSEEHTSELQS